MQVKVNAKEMYDAVWYCSKVADQKSEIAILGDVIMDAYGDNLCLTTTDLEKYISVIVKPVYNKHNGSAVVSCVKLLNTLKQLKACDEEVLITDSCDQGKLAICAGKYEVLLETRDPENFPQQAMWDGESDFCSVKLDRKDAYEICYKTMPCISKEHNRYVFTGANFKVDADKVSVYATDGYVLAKVVRSCQTSTKPGSFTIKADALNIIYTVIKLTKRELGKEEVCSEPVYISATGERFLCKFKNFSIGGKVIEGDYPDMDKAFERQTSRSILFQTDQVREALSTLSAFANGTYPIVNVEFTPGDPTTTIVHQDPDTGQITASVDTFYTYDQTEHTKPEDHIFGFDAKLLKKVIDILSDKLFALEGNGPGHMFDIIEDHDRYAVMPVRI